MCEGKVFLRFSLSFSWVPLLSADLLAWYFCSFGQRFPPLLFTFLMNYKVGGGPLGLAGWGSCPGSRAGARAVCGTADAQLRLSVSETARSCRKVHVALAVVTVSLAYVAFIYPVQVLCHSFACASLLWTE